MIDGPEVHIAGRVGWSAFLGTVIEYYDFTLYGLLGPVVFDKIFFPKTDPMVATLVVLVLEWAYWLARRRVIAR